MLQTPIIEGSAGAGARLDGELRAGREAWHTIRSARRFMSRAGLAQTWGGPIQEIKAGDVISFEPGEKHWHGAGRRRR